jgi:anti-anti-sigma regulatory factor
MSLLTFSHHNRFNITTLRFVGNLASQEELKEFDDVMTSHSDQKAPKIVADLGKVSKVNNATVRHVTGADAKMRNAGGVIEFWNPNRRLRQLFKKANIDLGFHTSKPEEKLRRKSFGSK